MLIPRAILCLIVTTILIFSMLACVDSNNPDQIRQKTAQATETLRRDTKAMAEGVKEGLSSGKTVNLNKASREDLLTLPGLTDREANSIVADRPFRDTHELVTRRIVNREEYDKIKDRIIAGQ